MKLPKLKMGDPVQIVWEDACAPFMGWGREDQMGGVERVVSLGCFHSSDARRFTIFHSYSTEADAFGGVLHIPIGTIVRCRKLG